MKKFLISHRGNINGKNEVFENHPDYITTTIDKGYSCEIDVWWANWSISNDRRKDYKDYYWFLGHNFPTYKIGIEWLKIYNEIDSIWCHAKNIDTLYELQKENIHCFFHDRDSVTLTSRGFLWTYPGKKLTKNSICVLPETTKMIQTEGFIQICAGVCSDFIKEYKEILNVNNHIFKR